MKVRRFLNDQHLQATLASIQRLQVTLNFVRPSALCVPISCAVTLSYLLQAWEPGLQTSIRELETVESAVARRMHKFAEISKAKLAALGIGCCALFERCGFSDHMLREIRRHTVKICS
mgnify:FL=1